MRCRLDLIKLNSATSRLRAAYVAEASCRPFLYHLVATRSIEVIDVGHRTLKVIWGRCRTVRLLHLLLHFSACC
jgi:hypothetical protein